MVDWCRTGPRWASVSEVEVVEEEPDRRDGLPDRALRTPRVGKNGLRPVGDFAAGNPQVESHAWDFA